MLLRRVRLRVPDGLIRTRFGGRGPESAASLLGSVGSRSGVSA
jgi:hypothetical protein